MANGGFTYETGTQCVEEGHADLIVFGQAYVLNPDLVERFLNGWPLNAPKDYHLWITASPEPKGYIDWPTYEEVRAQQLAEEESSKQDTA